MSRILSLKLKKSLLAFLYLLRLHSAHSIGILTVNFSRSSSQLINKLSKGQVSLLSDDKICSRSYNVHTGFSPFQSLFHSGYLQSMGSEPIFQTITSFPFKTFLPNTSTGKRKNLVPENLLGLMALPRLSLLGHLAQ